MEMRMLSLIIRICLESELHFASETYVSGHWITLFFLNKHSQSVPDYLCSSHWIWLNSVQGSGRRRFTDTWTNFINYTWDLYIPAEMKCAFFVLDPASVCRGVSCPPSSNCVERDNKAFCDCIAGHQYNSKGECEGTMRNLFWKVFFGWM